MTIYHLIVTEPDGTENTILKTRWETMAWACRDAIGACAEIVAQAPGWAAPLPQIKPITCDSSDYWKDYPKGSLCYDQ